MMEMMLTPRRQNRSGVDILNQKKFHMPTAYTILFLLLILVAAATWIIPAGSYDYVDGVPVAGTYHTVEQNPQGVGDVLKAAFSGFYDAVDVCIFILMVGGFLGVVMKTGAVDAGVGNVIRLLGGREKWLIPILMLLFGLGGTTYGMWEETMAFYPLLIPVFLAAGYDAVVGISVILLGAGAGVIASTVNPFATGIAAGFAGVSLGEGIVLRLLEWVAFEAAAIWFVMAYAAKVKKNPSKSVVGVGAGKIQVSMDQQVPFTAKRKVIMALFTLTFLIMVYAVVPFDEMGLSLPALGWWFPELSALFLVAGVVIGLIDRMSEEELVETYVAGCADLLGGLYHRHQPGHHCADERRRHHRHGPPLGRAGPFRRRGHQLHAAGVRPVPAPHHPDPVLVGPGDTVHPHCGAPGQIRRGGRRSGGDSVPVRLRPGEHHHPYCGGGDGRPGPGPCALRPLGEVCVEADTLVFAAGPGVPGGGCAAGIEKAKRARFSVRAFLPYPNAGRWRFRRLTAVPEAAFRGGA